MSLRPAAVNFDNVWNPLKGVVSRIVKCEQVSRSVWNESFSDVYSLCVARPNSLAEPLYKETCQLLEKRVAEIEIELQDASSDQLLPLYTRSWSVFRNGVLYLQCLYGYLNTQYVKNRRPMDSDMCYGNVNLSKLDHNMEIQELGMDYWRSLINRHEDRLIQCLMREIKNDRNDQCGQQNYLSAVIESFLEVEKLRLKNKRVLPPLYSRIFQEPLMKETQDFYKQWSIDNMETMTCSEYMAAALKLRERETNRAERYYPTSKAEIFKLFQNLVVIQQLSFFNQHVTEIVRQEIKIDLRNMYELLSPNNLYCEIQNQFSLNVKEAVTNAMDSIVAGPSAQVQLVENLIAIRIRVMAFIKEVFQDEHAFRNSIDKAFSLAINDRPGLEKDGKTKCPRPAELLCKYADTLLRKTPKGLSENDIDDKLNNVITLFKYIDDKDLFQKFYQRMMCKRLILGLSASMDAEEAMINRMKAVCGYEFTSKFHRMYQDIQLASETNTNFKKHIEEKNVTIPFSYNFLILTHCSWPISPVDTEFSLPADLHTCLKEFELFYASHYHGRKLRWVHQQATVDVRLCYADKHYLVTMSVLQASLLLHLDTLDRDDITLTQLEAATQLKDQELLRVVQSLVEAKILSTEDELSFQLCRSYTNKRTKFKVTLGQQIKETVDNEHVERQVIDDRRFFIQAAVVRTMKSRRQIRHNMLIKEVLDQSKSRFQPTVTMIKRCIENLIDKAYMERTPNTTDEYTYLA